MKRGDRVIQEHITNEWIGIFYLLKNHKYVDICLSAVETEYSKITYKELMSIRINHQSGIEMVKTPKEIPIHYMSIMRSWRISISG